MRHLLIALIASSCLASIAAAAPTAYYCAATGSYYQAFRPSPVRPKWRDARDGAAARTYTDPQGTVRPGRLVTVNSATESAFIASTFAVPGVDYWTYGVQSGGSPEPAGGWGWLSGEPMDFKHWAPNSPDNHWGRYGYNENRLRLLGSGARWDDYPGGWRCDGYIVEYPGPANLPPEADAGGPYEATTTACSVDIDPDTINVRSRGRFVTAYMMVDSGAAAEVALDGTASSDPDGDPLNYEWTVIDSNGDEVTTATGATPTVSLYAGQYAVSLVVDDGQVDSDPDTTTVDVVLLDPAAVDAADVTACGPAPGTAAQCLRVTLTEDGLLVGKFSRLGLCRTLIPGQLNVIMVDGVVCGQDTVRVINPGKKGKK
jgi:hypothetical protein